MMYTNFKLILSLTQFARNTFLIYASKENNKITLVQ
jgi:hypothetical protein